VSLDDALQRAASLLEEVERAEDPDTLIDRLSALEQATKELLAQIEEERRRIGAGA
jgi:hypothetical protein